MRWKHVHTVVLNTLCKFDRYFLQLSKSDKPLCPDYANVIENFSFSRNNRELSLPKLSNILGYSKSWVISQKTTRHLQIKNSIIENCLASLLNYIYNNYLQKLPKEKKLKDSISTDAATKNCT